MYPKKSTNMSLLQSYSCYLSQNIIKDVLIELMPFSAVSLEKTCCPGIIGEDSVNDGTADYITAGPQKISDEQQIVDASCEIDYIGRRHFANRSPYDHANCDKDVDENKIVLFSKIQDNARVMADQILDSIITDIKLPGQIYSDRNCDIQDTNSKYSVIKDVIPSKDACLQLEALSNSVVKEIMNSASLNLVKLGKDETVHIKRQHDTYQTFKIESDRNPSAEPIFQKKVQSYALRLSYEITTHAIKALHDRDNATAHVKSPEDEKYCKKSHLKCKETSSSESFDIQLCDTFLHAVFSTEKHFMKGRNLKFKSKRQVKLDKKKRKLYKDMEKIEVPTYDYEEMGFWTSRDLNTEMQDTICCPVCFEVYYNPYHCMPCEHSFCEPCLRRLAKYNNDCRRENRCPICREPISHCHPNQVLKTQVESFYPGEYNRRQKADGHGKYMSHPLPSKTTSVSLKNIARLISERNRTRQQTRSTRYFDADFSQYNWKLVVFIIVCFLFKGCILVGVIWIYNYFTKGENINSLHGVWTYLVENVWHYRDLDEESKIKVSNLFAVIAIIMVLYLALVSVSSKRYAFVQR